ncbi:MAG: methyltransferase domain-containing protein [Nitrososphaerota archaeon]|nr:methyltransferase domain-containing protein [Nitrososphaerota archaeon]
MIDYDKMAAEYAKYRDIHPEVFEALISEGKIASSSRVLEVGCGTGNYMGRLSELIGCQSYGIDPSEQMLSTAREKFPLLSLYTGKAEKLDFGQDYFDLVFSVDVIHHITDHSSYFREAHRVLKRGGKVCTVTDSEWIIRNRLPQSLYFPESAEAELKRYPKISVIKDFMKEAGFNAISETMVEREYELNDIEGYRKKVFSSLLLMTEEEFQRGLKRMEEDLLKGSIKGISRYLLVWGIK